MLVRDNSNVGVSYAATIYFARPVYVYQIRPAVRGDGDAVGGRAGLGCDRSVFGRSGPLSGVTGMLSEVGPDSGVLLFVSAGGCRERCAFGRAAVQPEGSPLPASEPLSRHLETGDTVLFDCRPTTTAPHCRWLADKVGDRLPAPYTLRPATHDCVFHASRCVASQCVRI